LFREGDSTNYRSRKVVAAIFICPNVKGKCELMRIPNKVCGGQENGEMKLVQVWLKFHCCQADYIVSITPL
jgi:hypothetical protein